MAMERVERARGLRDRPRIDMLLLLLVVTAPPPRTLTSDEIVLLDFSFVEVHNSSSRSFSLSTSSSSMTLAMEPPRPMRAICLNDENFLCCPMGLLLEVVVGARSI